MSKPEVTLENYQAVYDYYQDHFQNPQAAWVSHALLGAGIKPDVDTLHADVSDQLMSFHEAGYQFVITPIHVSDMDPPVTASLTRHYPPFAPLEGDTFILTKATLFQNPLLRRTIDGLGAIPLFRTSDIGPDNQPLPEDVRELRKAALERSFAMARHKLINQHQNMAIFPEGTRNTIDPARVQKLGFGLGKIACNLPEDVKLVIVPVGFCYGNPEVNASHQSGRSQETDNTSKLSKMTGMIQRINVQRKPFVVIGEPIAGPFESPDSFYPELHNNMQDAVDAAKHNYELTLAA